MQRLSVSVREWSRCVSVNAWFDRMYERVSSMAEREEEKEKERPRRHFQKRVARRVPGVRE